MSGEGSADRVSPRSAAENAELALLLEVAGTPKPGNVDRRRDLPDLRFEHFLAGAVGARRGLRLAADAETPVGEAFETAVRGMSRQPGDNTQFGSLLLLVPLVRAAGRDDLAPADVREVVESTTVDDAVAFYRAFEHVDVAVRDPPADADDLDVRHGDDAEPVLRDRGLSLYDVLDLAADPGDDRIPDGNAREWTTGFALTFDAADGLLARDGPVLDRVALTFLDLLATQPDSHVATRHGAEVARDVVERAAAVRGDLDAAEDLAEEFVAAGINPGTTADVTAAATFVALERGLEV